APGSPRSVPTRTVAIIKPHALEHRFDIEQRITEASFEIVKERQMEFDVESDPDTLYELFGEDAQSFAEGPVWVYVLERRRAVEVWHTIMGDADPVVARTVSPNSLRALYGIGKEQNAVMGSPDIETADIQIASLFASSPPFPTTELPEDAMGSLRSVSSSLLSSLRREASHEPPASVTSGGSVQSRRTSVGPDGTPKGTFKARTLPSSHATPSIVPRTTRAADLRAGLKSDKPEEKGPRQPLGKEKLTKIFANTPGHKRAETISVASTAAPTIAPRMTRAAALRLGIQPPPAAVRTKTAPAATGATTKETHGEDTFDGVPGHKRRESIAVSSTRAPTVAPRLNKSAALRASKEAAPPTSYQFRGPTSSNGSSRAPSLSRSSSLSSLGRPPASRNSSSVSNGNSTVARPPPSSFKGSFSKEGIPSRPASTTPARPASTTPSRPPSATPKPRPSSLQMPTMTPRQNKSALLRAQKMAEANSAKPMATSK
ncbi:hypothetical protein K488DRAFT_21710, partial [Vararia minispora EC-137]